MCRRLCRLWVAGLMVPFWLLVSTRSVAADEARQVGAVPQDACILELSAPEGAAVAIDGADQGTQRLFEFRPLESGTICKSELSVQHPGKEKTQLTLLVRAGWRIHLSLPDPSRPRPELVLQVGHSDEIGSVAFSPDGRQVLTGSRDGTAILWDAQSGAKLRMFRGDDEVSAAVFSPDGKSVVTVTKEKAIVWDAVSGQETGVLFSPEKDFDSVAFSPDGRYLVTAGSWSGEPVLWNAASGTQVRVFDGMVGHLFPVAFSPDSAQILTGSVLWDAASGRPLRQLKGHTDDVTSGAFSPNGHQMLTGSKDGTAILWDVHSGDKKQTFTNRIADGDFSEVTSIAFAPDGQQVLIGATVGHTAIWDIRSGQKIRSFEEQEGYVTSVAFSLSGRQAITGSSEGTATVWDAISGNQVLALGRSPDEAGLVVVSPDGRALLTGRADHFAWGETAVLWDLATGAKSRAFGVGEDFHSVISAAVGFDGRRLLTGGRGDDAILWDIASGDKIRAFEGHDREITSVDLSADGRQAITGASGGVFLWNVDTGEKRDILRDASSPVAFGPDGKHVLTGTRDKKAVLWDASSGEKLKEFGTGSDDVYSVAFSRDGSRVLTGTKGSRAILWDLTSGRQVHDLKGDSDGDIFLGCSVAFSPDGGTVLTGGPGKQAFLWDATSGDLLRTFDGHRGPITGVAFGTDGRRALTGSQDGSVILWDVATGQELARLLSFENNKDWLLVTPEGLFDGSPGGRARVSFRVDGKVSVVRDDGSFAEFYRPGLLATLWQGNQPPAPSQWP